MKGLMILVVVLIIGGFGWWFVKSSTPTNSNTIPNTSASIEIKDSKYNPETLRVKAGEKVTVTNADIMAHSVTADDESFDTGILSQGESGSFTAPSKPGEYKFHCLPHPSITGTLIVE